MTARIHWAQSQYLSEPYNFLVTLLRNLCLRLYVAPLSPRNKKYAWKERCLYGNMKKKRSVVFMSFQWQSLTTIDYSIADNSRKCRGMFVLNGAGPPQPWYRGDDISHISKSSSRWSTWRRSEPEPVTDTIQRSTVSHPSTYLTPIYAVVLST